ncbi:MAG TPA: hypothetical protein VFR85_10935 [Anaeromyxobacteraceae bacterium]|nr:hypothetical protein [Anaeromyxobacteraceae bacterium]
MKRYLVIMGEYAGHGRGVNGRTFYRFLQTYAGRRAVACCTPRDLLGGGSYEAEYVFLALPSSVCDRHLARLRFRHLVPFDLSDCHYPLWDDSNRDWLRSRCGLYLKAWTDEAWDFGIPMGLAPVRRYAKLRLELEADRIRRRLGFAGPPPRFDVLFLGAATGRNPMGMDPERVPNQRVTWLLELRERGRHLKVWGGLLARTITPELVRRYGDLSDFTIQGKVPFRQYFRALRSSGVALTPEGNAPWSYRHYEAIYARSMIVTCDMRRIHTLVPLPREGMVHVEPGQPVLPAIERALALRRELPEILEENVRFLERWLERGMYTRRRPELFERFLTQLPGAARA